jgi:para-aminobenzoate synthetase component I
MPIWENDYFTFIPPNEKTPQAFIAWGAKRVFQINPTNLHAFEELNEWISQAKHPIFGYLAYEAKQLTEDVGYQNTCEDGSQLIKFYEAESVYTFQNHAWKPVTEEKPNERSEVNALWDFALAKPTHHEKISFTCEEAQESYLEKFNHIQEQIQRGNYYETNFCMGFTGEGKLQAPLEAFKKLNEKTEAPYAVYYSDNDTVLLCSSPELFVKRKGNKLTSSPIKGTIKRGHTPKEDSDNQQQLLSSEKERSENIMIVDLVRNDLSRIATKNSVQVESLCALHTFKNLHHLISDVSCEVEEDTSFTQIMKALFPMGSMTGAPKISAVKDMEKIEAQSRGLYSGSFGYILPNGDFEFNVIIRSAIHDKRNAKTYVKVGSAITRASVGKQEFDECLLKAAATLAIFE